MKLVVYDLKEQLRVITEVSFVSIGSAVKITQNLKKVMHFLKEHENNIAIQKLKRNLPITSSDIAELERILFESDGLGTREDFEKAYGKQEHLGLFIRSLVGLDREAAKQAFGEYLSRTTLARNQISFINQIIEYLTQNGVMDATLLYQSPFTDYAAAGLDGVFKDQDANGIVSVLESIREAAVA